MPGPLHLAVLGSWASQSLLHARVARGSAPRPLPQASRAQAHLFKIIHTAGPRGQWEGRGHPEVNLWSLVSATCRLCFRRSGTPRGRLNPQGHTTPTPRPPSPQGFRLGSSRLPKHIH